MGEIALAIADFDVDTAVDVALECAHHPALPCNAFIYVQYRLRPADFHHQLAFLTPGIFPSRAFIRNGY